MAPSITDHVPDGSRVGLDTNIFIYYIEANPTYLTAVEPVFERIYDGSIVAHVSALTLTEVLIKPMRLGLDFVVEDYRKYLTRGGNVRLHDVDQALAEQAAALGGVYGLRTPDAIVCATAMRASCDFLVTNDDKFDRVRDIKILKVDDYVT